MSSPPDDPDPPKTKKTLDSSVTRGACAPSASTMNSLESRFEDRPKFRSVGVADRRAQIGGPVGSAGPVSFGEGSTPRDFGAFEFTMPQGKERSVGGITLRPPPVAPTRPGGPYKRSQSSSAIATPLSMAGIEGVDGSLLLSGTAFGNNCRLIVPPSLTISDVTNRVASTFNALGVDFELLHEKAKYKCLLHDECNWVEFVMQIFRNKSATSGEEELVLEAARRDGCSITFRRMWHGVKSAVSSVGEEKKYEAPAVANYLNLPPSPHAELEFTPYVEMLTGQTVDQHLYASQVIARICRSSTTARRSVASSAPILEALVSCASQISVTDPLPLQSAVLGHVCYALALISEDHLSSPSLAAAGALPLFLNVSGGLSSTSPPTPTQPTFLDLSRRREAARALANVCTHNDRSWVLNHLTLSAMSPVKGWCSWVETVEDERLRLQCKRVKAKLEKGA
mmetsp:Transcript_7504/g.14854  ORF Transcript_7504/g.14854 Transcript_7504/m.14854 type:complete len:454 (+) Transcript_7504:73-1434(+)